MNSVLASLLILIFLKHFSAENGSVLFRILKDSVCNQSADSYWAPTECNMLYMVPGPGLIWKRPY